MKTVLKLPLIRIGFYAFIILSILITAYTNLVGAFQFIGATPHYYVDTKASADVKSTAVYRQYANIYADNTTAAKAAVSLSTADRSITPVIPHKQGVDKDLTRYFGNGYTAKTFYSVVPQLVEIINNESNLYSKWYEWDDVMKTGASCDLSVALAYWWSGTDINFPACLGGKAVGGEGGQWQYLNGALSSATSGSGNWVEVPRGAEVLPGDLGVGIDEEGNVDHIWMYVATWNNGWIDNSIVQEKYPGSNANRYEGSYHQYYASLSHESNPWNPTTHMIFRYIGSSTENELHSKLTGVVE